MAGQIDGTVLMNEPCAYVGAFKRQILLVTLTTVADNSVWIDASDLLYFTIEFAGTATSLAAQLFATNSQAVPATGAGGTAVGAAITTNGIYTFTGPYRWINLRVTSVTGGNTQAVLQALTQ